MDNGRGLGYAHASLATRLRNGDPAGDTSPRRGWPASRANLRPEISVCRLIGRLPTSRHSTMQLPDGDPPGLWCSRTTGDPDGPWMRRPNLVFLGGCTSTADGSGDRVGNSTRYIVRSFARGQ